jgi:Lipoprotein signal peptidase
MDETIGAAVHLALMSLGIVISNFFHLVDVTNTGAAFGSFRNNNTFFIAISTVALVIVVALLVRRRSRDILRDVSLALLLAGVLGNLTDRLLYGHVIDFLLFRSACSICPSLAGLQCRRFLHLHCGRHVCCPFILARKESSGT